MMAQQQYFSGQRIGERYWSSIITPRIKDKTMSFGARRKFSPVDDNLLKLKFASPAIKMFFQFYSDNFKQEKKG